MKKKEKKKAKKTRILGKSIEIILIEINKRLEIENFEIDKIILLKNKNSNCIFTLTDSKSRFEIMRFIPKRTKNTTH